VLIVGSGFYGERLADHRHVTPACDSSLQKTPKEAVCTVARSDHGG